MLSCGMSTHVVLQGLDRVTDLIDLLKEQTPTHSTDAVMDSAFRLLEKVTKKNPKNGMLLYHRFFDTLIDLVCK